jgi:uncharacterized membrane protein YGL010W
MLDLMDELTKYREFHRNSGNQLLHVVTVRRRMRRSHGNE